MPSKNELEKSLAACQHNLRIYIQTDNANRKKMEDAHKQLQEAHKQNEEAIKLLEAASQRIEVLEKTVDALLGLIQNYRM